MKIRIALLAIFSAMLAAGGPQPRGPNPIGPPGMRARYRIESESALRASVVKALTVGLGPIEKNFQWLYLDAEKANGGEFRIWILSAGYPGATLPAAQRTTARYVVQEGSSAREYRNPETGEAVLPGMGGWEHLLPRPAGAQGDEVFPPQVHYLGHRYIREAAGEGEVPAVPEDRRIVDLRPDVLIGPAHNTRQKDETRRYDGSDYELVRLTREDYRTMAEAGINCVAVDAEQARWAEELGLFYWGTTEGLPYPELLYRSQYVGPALFLDEPAVGTRDYVLRPKLAKDAGFRKALTPQIAFESFREHYRQALLKGAPTALMRALNTRADVDPGDMNLRQENLYTWETMVSTSAYQLSQDPLVPAAFVFEPPGRIGTRRTLPEMNMTYGTGFPADDAKAFADLIFGFPRGAARLTGKSWGVSIYGAVDRADTFWWFTHAYDMGATRFFFWDSAALACVPFGEYLALARHLRAHAASHPRPDLERLRRAAETAILLPPGYDLGHVQMGKGSMWGLSELNLERANRRGVKYRVVMSNFFREAERCVRLGVAFDALWDLPGLQLKGYREVVRVREDGKVEVQSGANQTVLESARVAARPPGTPPELSVTITGRNGAKVEVSATARVTETTALVYYTYGADPAGVYRNAMVGWELYGPGEEDYVYLVPERLRPHVRRDGGGAEIDVRFKLDRPGRYRLRAATVDVAGRTSVIWKTLTVSGEPGNLRWMGADQ